MPNTKELYELYLSWDTLRDKEEFSRRLIGRALLPPQKNWMSLSDSIVLEPPHLFQQSVRPTYHCTFSARKLKRGARKRKRSKSCKAARHMVRALYLSH
jgi:hypothetical protein